MSVLEAIRAERELVLAPVKDRLAKLDELEALALDLEGEERVEPAAGPPVKTAAKSASSRPRRRGPVGRDGLTAGAQEILDAVRGGADTLRAISAETGRTTGAVSFAMRQLVERRLVEPTGKTSQRRYHPADGRSDARVKTEEGIERSAAVERKRIDRVKARNGNGNGSPPADTEYLVRRLVAELEKGPATADKVAAAIDAPVADVFTTCDRLVKDGVVSLMGDGTYVA